MELKTFFNQVNFYSLVNGFKLSTTSKTSKRLKAYIKNQCLDRGLLIYESVYEIILNKFSNFLSDSAIDEIYYLMDE